MLHLHFITHFKFFLLHTAAFLRKNIISDLLFEKKGAKMKKSKIKITAGIFSSIILFVIAGAFILSLTLPESIVIAENEKNGKWMAEGWSWLCKSEEVPTEQVWQNNADSVSTSGAHHINATVYFCGIIPLKNVDIAVWDELTVIPGGDAIGISLKPKGILVADIGEIVTSDGTKTPGKDAGFAKGDLIQKIDGQRVATISDVQNCVEKAGETLTIQGMRGEKNEEWIISPEKDEKGRLKIGLWIRDTVAGIGTLTFCSSEGFGALGHPISDIDTGIFVEAGGGSIYRASIVGVEKGQKGAPGSLCGLLSGEVIGNSAKNSDCGVFGNTKSGYFQTAGQNQIPVAKKSEIRCTDATIRCNIGDGVEDFSIKIERILNGADSGKGMVIAITDQRLIEQTGGIVQGMSGSPIIQNNKLVGAVTHVYVRH